MIGIGLVLLAGLLADGAAEGGEKTPPADPRDRVVALVNGERITMGDLEVRLRDLHEGAEATGRHGFDIDRLMTALVNDWLIATEARTLGLDGEEKTRDQVDRFRRKRMVEALEREAISARSVPTEAEVQAAFRDRYRRVSLRVITVDSREEAEGILARVREGAEMGGIARERSVDPYAPRDGRAEDLLKRDLLTEIGQLVEGMQPGEIGGPVRTDLGWSVIRLESSREADPALLPQIASTLREVVKWEKSQALRSDLSARAGKNHPVHVDQGMVAEIRPRPETQGRLAPSVAARDAIVVRVGETIRITAGEYADALLLRWSGVRNREAAEAASPIVLRKLIDEALLLAEARSLGYGERPEVARAVRGYETRILVQRYLDEVIVPGVQVSREEVEAHFASHLDSFHKPPRVRLAQITVATEPEAAEIAQLLRSGTDPAWLARQRSIDRLAEGGGDLGWKVPVPGAGGADADLLLAEPGAVLGPYGGSGSFVVWAVLGREEQGGYSLEEVSAAVRDAVFADKFRRAVDGLVARLRERSEIRIFDEALVPLRGSAPGTAPAG